MPSVVVGGADGPVPVAAAAAFDLRGELQPELDRLCPGDPGLRQATEDVLMSSIPHAWKEGAGLIDTTTLQEELPHLAADPGVCRVANEYAISRCGDDAKRIATAPLTPHNVPVATAVINGYPGASRIRVFIDEESWPIDPTARFGPGTTPIDFTHVQPRPAGEPLIFEVIPPKTLNVVLVLPPGNFDVIYAAPPNFGLVSQYGGRFPGQLSRAGACESPSLHLLASLAR